MRDVCVFSSEESRDTFLGGTSEIALFSSVLWGNEFYFPQLFEEINFIFLSPMRKYIPFSSVLWDNTSYFPVLWGIFPIFLNTMKKNPYTFLLFILITSPSRRMTIKIKKGRDHMDKVSKILLNSNFLHKLQLEKVICFQYTRDLTYKNNLRVFCACA